MTVLTLHPSPIFALKVWILPWKFYNMDNKIFFFLFNESSSSPSFSKISSPLYSLSLRSILSLPSLFLWSWTPSSLHESISLPEFLVFIFLSILFLSLLLMLGRKILSDLNHPAHYDIRFFTHPSTACASNLKTLSYSHKFDCDSYKQVIWNFFPLS